MGWTTHETCSAEQNLAFWLYRSGRKRLSRHVPAPAHASCDRYETLRAGRCWLGRAEPKSRNKQAKSSLTVANKSSRYCSSDQVSQVRSGSGPVLCFFRPIASSCISPPFGCSLLFPSLYPPVLPQSFGCGQEKGQMTLFLTAHRSGSSSSAAAAPLTASYKQSWALYFARQARRASSLVKASLSLSLSPPPHHVGSETAA
jgi:hypothetical protein